MSELWTEDDIERALAALTQTHAVYPSGAPDAHLNEWFKIDAQDAVEFGVLKEPKWDGYSDIAIMQHEWYIAAVLKAPFRVAVKVLAEKAHTRIAELEADLERAQRHISMQASDLARMEEEIAGMRAGLTNVSTTARCPRPCNNRPDDFSVSACVEAGECGCCAVDIIAYRVVKP